MAKTEDIEAKLAAYIDGDIDEAGRAEIEKHLAGNASHRHLIEQLKQHRDMLRSLPHELAPLEVSENINAQLERAVLLGDVDGEVEADTMRIGRWYQVRAIAAILLLTASLAAVITVLLPSPNRKATELADIRDPAAPLAVTLERLADDEPAPASAAGLETPSEAGKAGGEKAAMAVASRDMKLATEPFVGKGEGPTTPDAGAIAMGSQSPTLIEQVNAAAGLNGVPADTFTKDGRPIISNSVDPGTGLYGELLASSRKASAAGTQDPFQYVIATDHPDLYSREVTRYLTRNNLSWEVRPEAAPEPIDLAKEQELSGARAMQQSVQMKGGTGQTAFGNNTEPPLNTAAPPPARQGAMNESQGFDSQAQYSIQPQMDQQSANSAIAGNRQGGEVEPQQAQQPAESRQQVASGAGGRGGSGRRGGGSGGAMQSQVVVPAAGYNFFGPEATPERIVAKQLTREQAAELKQGLDELSLRLRGESAANGPAQQLSMSSGRVAEELDKESSGAAIGASGMNSIQANVPLAPDGAVSFGPLDRSAPGGVGLPIQRNPGIPTTMPQQHWERVIDSLGLSPLSLNYVGFKALPPILNGGPATTRRSEIDSDIKATLAKEQAEGERADFVIIVHPQPSVTASPTAQPQQPAATGR